MNNRQRTYFIALMIAATIAIAFIFNVDGTGANEAEKATVKITSAGFDEPGTATREPSVSAPYAWRELHVSGPGARQDHAMVFNAKKKKIVLFGGKSSGITTTFLNDTWTWNGKRWKRINTTVAPPARAGHALAYDETRKRVVLFGGRDGEKYMNDTWIWQGKSWKQLFPVDSPTARSQHDMVFDSMREVVVLFGGNELSPVDTWEWDGSNWQNVIPPDMGWDFLSRNGPAMAYDNIRNMTIMFGGEIYPGRGGWVSNETWSWDGNDWTRLLPTRSPHSSDDRRMVFDSDRGFVILFGGNVMGFEGSQVVWRPTDETWRFNGKGWRKIWPVSTVPASAGVLERGQHAMAYDPLRKEVVVFGGEHNGTPLDDTWVFSKQKK